MSIILSFKFCFLLGCFATQQARKPRATLVWNYDSLTDSLTYLLTLTLKSQSNNTLIRWPVVCVTPHMINLIRFLQTRLSWSPWKEEQENFFLLILLALIIVPFRYFVLCLKIFKNWRNVVPAGQMVKILEDKIRLDSIPRSALTLWCWLGAGTPNSL